MHSVRAKKDIAYIIDLQSVLVEIMMDIFQTLKVYNKPKISPIAAIQACRLLGPKFFLQKLKYQIYSQTTYLCLGKQLEKVPRLPEYLNFLNLSLASPEDVELFFEVMAKEGKRSFYEMLIRKNFYENGFRNCYIGRLNDSREMATITWLVSADEIRNTKFENRYPFVDEDVTYGENIYTLKKFRGMGAMNSTGRQQELIAEKLGFKKILFYVKENNLPSIKSSMRRGHVVHSKFTIYHRLFFVNMVILEQHSAPIPISIQ